MIVAVQLALLIMMIVLGTKGDDEWLPIMLHFAHPTLTFDIYEEACPHPNFLSLFPCSSSPVCSPSDYADTGTG